MYKRKREQEDLMNHRHSGIKEETHVEGDSNEAALAGGPMREPTAGGEGGSSASWQPRLYECQFCKRGFTSAQALGGHMNVHRRDRALGKAGFHGSVASNHRNTNNNNNNNHHVNILQPHGHMEKSRSSFYVGSASSFLLPYDQPSASASAAASQPSLFVPHVATRTNREKYRPELCIQCSSKSTHIIDQPNFRVEWHKSAAADDDDDDGEVDLELRLGEKP